jgi:hypothetical protein
MDAPHDRANDDRASTVDITALQHWYIDAHLTIAELALRLGCSPSTALRRLHAAGIPRRLRGPEPGRNRSERFRHPCGDGDWSAELAYAIGIIATDGNLSCDGRHLSIVSADREPLDSIKTGLRLDNQITPHGRNHRLQWGDKNFYDWLVTIGLHPRKSLTLGELAIPDGRFVDFFRGCIDGDGSVRVYTDRCHADRNARYVYERLYIRFFSSSVPFIEWIHAKVRVLLGANGSIGRRARRDRHPSWELRYAKRESIEVLRWMYYTPDVMCLRRKRAIADAFLSSEGHGILTRGAWWNWLTRRTQNPLPARA